MNVFLLQIVVPLVNVQVMTVLFLVRILSYDSFTSTLQFIQVELLKILGTVNLVINSAALVILFLVLML